MWPETLAIATGGSASGGGGGKKKLSGGTIVGIAVGYVLGPLLLPLLLFTICRKRKLRSRKSRGQSMWRHIRIKKLTPTPPLRIPSPPQCSSSSATI